LSTKYVAGSGEMARCTRDYPWDTTVLGPIDTWSDLLLGSVNLMLCCRFPSLIFWGDAMVQFYNDDSIPLIADKHPTALGQAAQVCWSEAWHIVGPQLDAVYRDGKTTFMEDVMVPVLRDGALHDVYWTYSYSPIHAADGSVAGILVVCQDKTREILASREHRQIEEQLLAERSRLSNLVQQAPAFIAVLRGPSHIYEVVNPRYQELIGPRTLIGRSVQEALPEIAQQGFLALLDQVYETGETHVAEGARFDVDRTTGHPREARYLDYVYQPMREANGDISGVIVLGIDVTERRRAENTLMKNEKLAEIGRLASSIAHEINNPLEAVMNLLYLARGDDNLSPETAQYLDSAELELRRVSVITNQTLSFYKKAANPNAASCDAMFASVLSIYQARLLTSQIAVETGSQSTVPVLCFEGEIRQVLSNLIGNAIDAMLLGGGRLLLRSRKATAWSTNQKGLMMTIADSGSGISPKNISRIFEAFFTTKGAAGNGLGLWISHEIIERHQGFLRVRSRQQAGKQGTVVTLFLPFHRTSSTPLPLSA
jgi:PAS domain S-box-containing protein